MGLYKNKCSPVPVFILHNKLFQVKWAKIPGDKEKVPSFLKMTGTFKGQPRQRPTAGKHENTIADSRGPQSRQPQQYGTPRQVPKTHARHTTEQKKKPPQIFPRRLCSNTYFIKNFCRSASVVSSPMVISSVPVRRANIAISSLVSAVDTTE